MRRYVFRARLQHEEDGRWSAWIPSLKGCAVWGYTEAEAREAIREAAELYVEDLLGRREPVPTEEADAAASPLIVVKL